MNFKSISLVCTISFVLSFFVALISGAGFGRSFLRALIIGVCFCILSFIINFLYNRFLKDESSDEQNSESNSEPVVTQVGGKVDITIDDEELPTEEVSPRFVLTGQNQMLNKKDLEEAKDNFEETKNKEESSTNSIKDEVELETNNALAKKSALTSNEEKSPQKKEMQQEFKPVALGSLNSSSNSSQTSSDFSSEFPDIENTLGKNSILAQDSEDEEESEIDEFPDVETASGKDETVTDSEFAEAGKPRAKLSDTYFADGSAPASKDSNLMAEAIRTILTKQE